MSRSGIGREYCTLLLGESVPKRVLAYSTLDRGAH
jgi:hypothetical protein